MELPLPGLMSSTSTVPAAVPSLFHSSTPLVPSLAVKKSVPFTFVSDRGLESPLPARMSLTSTVPAAVPSLFHSSTPVPSPEYAVKNNVPFTFVRNWGLMVEICTVPAAVPSLFHKPNGGRTILKNNVPFTSVSSTGIEPTRPVGSTTWATLRSTPSSTTPGSCWSCFPAVRPASPIAIQCPTIPRGANQILVER